MDNVKAIVEGDLVTGRLTGDALGPEIPENLLGLPDEALRFDGVSVIAAPTTTRNWYVDEYGRKRLETAEGRTRLSCRFTDRLVKTGAGWRAETQDDRDAAALQTRRTAARAECARRIFARASAATQANLSLYAGVLALTPAGSRSPLETADAAALGHAKAWIDAMRARWPEIAAQELDPLDDANWPEPTSEAIALAARF